MGSKQTKLAYPSRLRSSYDQFGALPLVASMERWSIKGDMPPLVALNHGTRGNRITERSYKTATNEPYILRHIENINTTSAASE